MSWLELAERNIVVVMLGQGRRAVGAAAVSQASPVTAANLCAIVLCRISLAEARERLEQIRSKDYPEPTEMAPRIHIHRRMASRQLLEVGLLLELGITCSRSRSRSRSAEADRTRRLSIPQPSYLLYDNAHNMAPNLAESQHALTHDMILSGTLSARQMANVAGCSKRTIHSHRLNVHYFGSTRAPPNGAGRRRSVTPSMLEALKDHLLEKPGQTLDEMALFLWDEFRVVITLMSISRALKSISWTKKVTRSVAKERNADLRDYYLHNLSAFQS